MRTVVLYTKPGCHLCDAVAQVIEAVRARHGFAFVARDIRDDPGDYERYKHDIPVVTLDGREIARHRMTVRELEAALSK